MKQKNYDKIIDKFGRKLSDYDCRQSVLSKRLTDTINGQDIINNRFLNTLQTFDTMTNNRINDTNHELSHLANALIIVAMIMLALTILGDAMVCKRIESMEKEIEYLKGQNKNVQQEIEKK